MQIQRHCSCLGTSTREPNRMNVMSKRNGKAIHGEALKKSSRDDIALAFKVEEGFLTICELWAREYGESLPIPKELDQHLFRWRTLSVRYKKGDFRNTESERKSLKVVAQWTVDVNMKLRGQPAKKIEWAD